MIAKSVKAPLKQPKNVPKLLRNLRVQQSLAEQTTNQLSACKFPKMSNTPERMKNNYISTSMRVGEV